MKKTTLLLVLFMMSFVNAQKHDLGQVTIAELQEKQHPKDTSAVAAVLFNVGRTYFEYSIDEGFYMMTEVSTKIKIYKKEGYKWANKSVAFYVGSNPSEVVSFSKVATYNLLNGAVEKTKIKSEGEFVEKINKFYSLKKFALPNVKEGSIVEYNYTVKSTHYATFPEWDFQLTIPVNFSEYSTAIPEYYSYNVHQKGNFIPSIKKDNIVKSITFREKFTSDYNKVDYSNNKTTYVLENIPAINDEAFINNIDNYSSGLKHELASTKFPNALFKNYAENWQGVTTSIYENENFGNELNKTSYFDTEINTVLAGISGNSEKINAIFKFVQDRMAWNNIQGVYCNDGVKKAFVSKVGNTADINLMLVAMLRYAGLDANPVLLSTRSNGIPFYASRTAFNHVIVAVEDGQDIILMDATSKYTKLGILPDEDLNWFGKLIRKDKTFQDIDLMPKKNAIKSIMMMANLDTNGGIKGKVKQQFQDNYALDYRDANNVLTIDARADKLEKRFSDIEIDSLSVQNKTATKLPIIETFQFQKNLSAESIGGKIYFSPLFFLSKSVNPFKQETREYPIDMGYPTRESISAVINLPEGYKVEKVPENLAIGMHDSLGSFRFIAVDNGNNVQISATIDINSAIFNADDYEDLKAFYAEIVKKEMEKIVLVKI